MTLNEIKNAVQSGKRVYWANTAYEVVKGGDEYSIYRADNENCIGLTWQDGITMNGKPEEFFVES